MTPTLLAALILLTVAQTPEKPAGKEKRLFELRTYYAEPGKLDDLNARFRNVTTKLFKKHGITNCGYWMPVENENNQLIYLLAYPDRAAWEKSWKAFVSDPDWNKAKAASEVNGKLVAKVESVFLNATDYSPVFQPKTPKDERVFELRIYKAAPGKMEALNGRFRDTTMRLIAKHGATNLGYWIPVEKAQGAEDTLIYLLAHKSRETAKESGEKFGKDPVWLAAREASEKDGPLVEKRESIFLKPTDYSPTK